MANQFVINDRNRRLLLANEGFSKTVHCSSPEHLELIRHYIVVNGELHCITETNTSSGPVFQSFVCDEMDTSRFLGFYRRQMKNPEELIYPNKEQMILLLKDVAASMSEHLHEIHFRYNSGNVYAFVMNETVIKAIILPPKSKEPPYIEWVTSKADEEEPLAMHVQKKIKESFREKYIALLLKLNPYSSLQENYSPFFYKEFDGLVKN